MKQSTQLLQCAAYVKAAFEEGYDSYATPCCPFNSVEEAWNESIAKDVYDDLQKRAQKAKDKGQ